MTLRKKTLLIFGLTLVSLLGVLYVLSSRILVGGFEAVEAQETERHIRRSIGSLDNDLVELENSTRDWAVWDDTYAFITDGNQDYIKNITTSFTNNQVNMMMFVNAGGEVVFAGAYDLVAGEEMPAPESWQTLLDPAAGLLSAPDARAGITGIILLPEAPMLLTACPILTSEGNGPSRGTVLWGRYLDAPQIGRLASLTNLSLSFYRLDDPELPADFVQARQALSDSGELFVQPLESDAIAGYALLDDIQGSPALIMRTDMPRTIYNEGLVTMHYHIAFVLGAGLIFGLVTISLMEVMVLSRMSRISEDVGSIGTESDFGSRVRISGGDELGILAGGINNMLDALQESQREVSQARDELELRVEERTAQLKDKVVVLQTLTEIDSEVMGATRSRAILDLVCQRAADLLHAPKSLIALVDSPETIHIAASVGFDHSDVDDIESAILPHLYQCGLNGANPDFCDAFAIDEISKAMPRLSKFSIREKVRSLAAAPMTTEGRVLGTLVVFDSVKRTWSADEIQVLGLLSAQAAIALDESRLFEEEKSRRQELSVLYGLSRRLAEAQPDIDTVLGLIVRHSVETTNVTFASIALVDEGDGGLTVRAAQPARTLAYDLMAAGDSAGRYLMDLTKGLVAPELIHDDEVNLNESERQALFPVGTRTLCLVPLHAGERFLGLLILGEARGEEREPFSPEKMRLARSIGDQTSSALVRVELFVQLEHSYLETVLSLANAVEAKDTYIAGHAESLARMALAIGERMGMDRNELESLRYGAILHDVGKIGVPDSILQKPARLDELEWEIMKQHPSIGARILTPVPRLSGAASIVHHHHESFDGTGYPDGTAGEEIPLGARILSVVDSYSAIIDTRPYKSARSSVDAIAELKRCSGSQFDPGIVEVFVDLIATGDLTRDRHSVKGKGVDSE